MNLNIVDGLTIIFVCGLLVKLADILLRPQQQKWLRDKADTVTLWLDYTKPIEWTAKLKTSAGAWILSALCICYIVVNYALEYRRSGRKQLFMNGREAFAIIGSWLLSAILIALIGRRLLGWVLRTDSFAGVLIRALPLFLLGALVLVLMPSLYGVIVNKTGAFGGNFGLTVNVLFFVLYPVIVLPAVLSSLLMLVLILSSLFRVLEIVFKVIRHVAWSIVEYSKGPVAALLVIVSVILLAVEAYLKNHK
jgi:hypothetical protein